MDEMTNEEIEWRCEANVHAGQCGSAPDEIRSGLQRRMRGKSNEWIMVENGGENPKKNRSKNDKWIPNPPNKGV